MGFQMQENGGWTHMCPVYINAPNTMMSKMLVYMAHRYTIRFQQCK